MCLSIHRIVCLWVSKSQRPYSACLLIRRESRCGRALAGFPHAPLVLCGHICYTLSSGLADLIHILSRYTSLPTALPIKAGLIPTAESSVSVPGHTAPLSSCGLPAMKPLFLFLAILLAIEPVVSGKSGLSSVWDPRHELLFFPLLLAWAAYDALPHFMRLWEGFPLSPHVHISPWCFVGQGGGMTDVWSIWHSRAG